MTEKTQYNSGSCELENSEDSGLNNQSLESSDDEGDEEKGNISRVPKESTIASVGPLRLLLVSSKIKNLQVIQSAVLPNVIFIQYRYEIATLDYCLGLIAHHLQSNRVASIAVILHSSHSAIHLTGKDDVTLNRNVLTENGPVQNFFVMLVNDHMTGESTRLDILACSSIAVDVAEGLAKDLMGVIGVPVSISKDIMGSSLRPSNLTERQSKFLHVGDLYFVPYKIRTWSGHIQTLAGFEKIRIVGKGAYGTAVLYRKKDDDSLVILKEINLHDLNVSERQLAQNEVRVLAMLDHPNIIGYYDSFEEDGTLMIEMEYADRG